MSNEEKLIQILTEHPELLETALTLVIEQLRLLDLQQEDG